MEEAYDALADNLAGSSVTVAKYNGDADREFARSALQTQTFPTILMLPKGSDKVIKYPTERRDTETLGLWVRAMASDLQ